MPNTQNIVGLCRHNNITNLYYIYANKFHAYIYVIKEYNKKKNTVENETKETGGVKKFNQHFTLFMSNRLRF